MLARDRERRWPRISLRHSLRYASGYQQSESRPYSNRPPPEGYPFLRTLRFAGQYLPIKNFDSMAACILPSTKDSKHYNRLMDDVLRLLKGLARLPG